MKHNKNRKPKGSRLLRSKRAIAFDSVWELVLLLFLLTVVLVFFFIIKWFANISLDTKKAEAETLINRFFYSPSCFSYDNGVRSYPGIVDIKRFNEKVLEDTIRIDKNREVAARISILDLGGKRIAGPLYYNKKWYERWEPVASFKGEGAATRHIESRYILIKDGDRPLTPAILWFKVLIPNS